MTNSDEGTLSKKEDILIPASTTTKGEDLVTACIVLEDNIQLGGDITILRTKNDKIINNYFLLIFFQMF